jgi:GNAT superfamily N-acetyltransferase
MIEIESALFPDDTETVRRLFREYAAALGVDLGFQDFEAELASLPGKYQAPGGRVMLARRGGTVLGCVAMRPLRAGDCEMKRLYVRPDARGEKLGRRLALRICDEARGAGHTRIFLDTLASMTSAQQLYRELGFSDVEPYVFNPLPGTRFMALDLDT